MSPSTSFLLRAWHFLGRVQFTMVLLLAGAIAMIAGTLVETEHGAGVARDLVYGAWWFDAFLFLLALNLIVAVTNRIPLRRNQLPFMVTHASIVLLLVGAWISHTYGFEGQMVIREGTTADAIYLDDEEIAVAWQQEGGGERAWPLEVARSGDPLPLPGDSGDTLRLLEHVDNGRPSLRLVDAEVGSPGVELSVMGAGIHTTGALVADHPRFRRHDLGPVEIEILVARSPEVLAERRTARTEGSAVVTVTPRGGAGAVRIPLPASLGDEVDCGFGVRAVVQRYLQHAVVGPNGLDEVPSGAINPAAVVEIHSPTGTETHTVFGQFPSFNMVKGRRGEPLVDSVHLEASGVGSKPLVTVLVGPSDELYLQLSASIGRGEAVPFLPGQTVAVGNLGIDVTVQRFVARAAPELGVVPLAHDDESGKPYVRVAVSHDGNQEKGWIARGEAGSFACGDRTLEVRFGRKQRSVPFSITLDAFELETHPGSNMPAAYRSRVKVAERAAGAAPVSTVISMNRPYDVAGYRLFQSSYRAGENGAPDISVFSVSHDPGVGIVYLALVLIILGVGWYVMSAGSGRGHAALGAGDPAGRDGRADSEPGVASTDGTPAVARLALGLLAGWLLALPAPAQASTVTETTVTAPSTTATRDWAILAGGRVKPLQTFARELALAVSGRASPGGMDPLDLLWGYHFAADTFCRRPDIRIDSEALKATLGVDTSTRRLSFHDLMRSEEFRTLVERATPREQAKEKLGQLEKDALALYRKLEMVAGVVSGNALRLVPRPGPGGPWSTPDEIRDAPDPECRAVYEGFVALSKAWRSGDQAAFDATAAKLGEALRAVDPAVYPTAATLGREVFYNDLDAFGKAWPLYLLSFVLMLVFGVVRRPALWRVAIAIFLVGFALHTTGFVLRWVIAGHAPVSDMYESLVFLGWGVAALGLVLEMIYRGHYFAVAAAPVSALTMIFARNLPLDSAIDPLVPVLANTSWLSIHVMTVVTSYSAFALAMALGHVVLAVQLFRPGKTETLRTLSRLLYKTLLVGALFLVAGIGFGAVWANESWGRYWGWDPKETWSLITFFVYLAVIHGRMAGWLHNFGLAVCSILAFLSVIMTYYGVNFVLGAGLHSYGFASGGGLWIGTYLLIELAVITVAALRYRMATRATGSSSVPLPDAT